MRRTLVIISLLALWLQACDGMSLGLIQGTAMVLSTPVEQATSDFDPMLTTPSSPTAQPPLATPLSKPIITPSPIPPTATPTLPACMLAGGRVEVSEFTTVLLPDPLVYRIYLPPCYDEQAKQTYPVLYLIHGQTYTDAQWDQLGVPETADRLIRAGEIVPLIVVMPRDRVWLEPTEDNFGKAVEQALVPWIDEYYHTIPDREYRAIGGLSRGAAWAVDIGISRWDLFSRVGVHSGFVFYSDTQQIYLWLHNTPQNMIPHIYMDVGDNDRPEISQGSTWLENFLTRYDIPHAWHLFSGEHDEAYWQAHLEDYLRWYTMDWGK